MKAAESKALGLAIAKLFWIADSLNKAEWSLNWFSALECEGRTRWIADAHRDDGKRFVVHADEILTAFLELGSAIKRIGSSLTSCTCDRLFRCL